MRLFVPLSPLAMTAAFGLLVLACESTPVGDSIASDDGVEAAYLDGTNLYVGSGGSFPTGGQSSVVVPVDWGMGGDVYIDLGVGNIDGRPATGGQASVDPVGSGGQSGGVGDGAGGGSTDPEDLPPSGSGRCEFEYSTCVAILFETCESESQCDAGIDSCVSDYYVCDEDEPDCDTEVSSCFAVAESCFERLGNDDSCTAHYGFCLNLAEECFER